MLIILICEHIFYLSTFQCILIPEVTTYLDMVSFSTVRLDSTTSRRPTRSSASRELLAAAEGRRSYGL